MDWLNTRAKKRALEDLERIQLAYKRTGEDANGAVLKLYAKRKEALFLIDEAIKFLTKHPECDLENIRKAADYRASLCLFVKAVQNEGTCSLQSGAFTKPESIGLPLGTATFGWAGIRLASRNKEIAQKATLMTNDIVRAQKKLYGFIDEVNMMSDEISCWMGILKNQLAGSLMEGKCVHPFEEIVDAILRLCLLIRS